MLQLAIGYWKTIVFGVLAVFISGLLMYNGHLKSVIKDKETEVLTLTAEIKTQNAAVEKLGAESAARAASAAEAQVSASKIRERIVTKVEKIYVQPPSTPGDGCKSALDLINEGNVE